MAEDNSIALGIKPIDIDVGKTLKSAADIQSSQAYTANTLAEAQRKQYDLSKDEIGRAAKHLLMMPAGENRDKLYKGYVEDFTKKGYMQPHEAEYWGQQKPSDLMLHQMVANSVSPATHGQMTGETAGNEAAQRSPYEVHPVNPETSLVRPGQLPGAPSATPRLSGSPVPGVTPRPVLPPAATTAQPAPATSANNSMVPTKPGDPVFSEVPKVAAPVKPAAPPGVALQGKDPGQLQANKAAVEGFQKNQDDAKSVSEQQANYSTLRTTLENGISTSKAGPALETVSGWMYAAGMDPKAIKEWTGTDPSQADILHKSTVQESMKFVRDTIGARESLMAINAITSAFPNLANTAEGNRMMVDIMHQMGEYKKERAKYETAFFEKNNHMEYGDRATAFNRWWGETHPAEQFISKALPRNPPRGEDGTISPSNMQNGVTYIFPDPKGGQDADGKPVYLRGKWDAKSGKMVTVK